RLVGASSPVAAQVEIHSHAMEGGLMTMRRLNSLPLNPGEYVSLEPGGKHLMLIGLKRPLKEGDQIALTLRFEKAPALEVMVTVEPLGATEPKMAGHEHSEGHHQDAGRGDGM
ncbi:MAG: copper chaperone PCu(A)C, partial [Gammaproteobacteria bacterium]|nr:copper chaperone PCu(A)C [Gammaproteobacteria bacterium]